MNYQPVIGVEIHAELLTNSKMFCGCAVVDSTSAPPNSVVCEICAGLPGTLPSLNARAVEFAVRVALALNCEIRATSIFARKNYFYPDLPKGYQISQYELPLAVNGWLEIETPRGPQRVRIRRVHLEEDTGKLNHVSSPLPPGEGVGVREDASLVDLNRAGVPLLEIVTEPDLHSAEEVKACAVALRAILRYLGVNSGDMEKGILRFEPNISVRPAGSTELRTRTELKNLNSFRALERGTLFEIERQIDIWESGGQVIQETRGWDEAKGETVSQRGKEHAHDYRYFPEPDLPPLVLTDEYIMPVRAALPELPAAKRARFQTEHGLSAYDAAVLTEEKAVAAYFEQAVKNPKSQNINPKAVANWMTGELFRLMNESGLGIEQIKVTPENLAALSGLVAANTLNSNTAKTVLAEMFQSGHAPQAIVEAKGLAQVSDNSALEKLVADVLAANPEQVASYVGGKLTLEQWFFGQVMKQSQGRGNPQVIKEILAEKLAQLKT